MSEELVQLRSGRITPVIRAFRYTDPMIPVRTILVLSLATLSSALANATEFTATWKVNPDKSKFGGDVMKTIKIEQTGSTLHITFDGVRNDGGNLHQEVIQICDGKEHARTVIGTKAESQTDICEQVNPSTIKFINKENGRITSENTFTLSDGGRVLTHVRTGRGAHTWVAERQ